MPDWAMVLLRPAHRYLDKLPPDEQQRVIDAIAELEQSPFGTQVKPLKGRPEWSPRVGELRIHLRVDRNAKQIVVTLIALRGEVYKR